MRIDREHTPHKRRQEDRKRIKHKTATVKVNGMRKKFVIDTGSPITIMPMDRRIVKPSEIQNITNRYQGVNKTNKMSGEILISIEYENNKQKMERLITERTDITTLLGMEWLKTFKLKMGRMQLAENYQSEREKVFNRFPDLFEKNKTIKDSEINIQ